MLLTVLEAGKCRIKHQWSPRTCSLVPWHVLLAVSPHGQRGSKTPAEIHLQSDMAEGTKGFAWTLSYFLFLLLCYLRWTTTSCLINCYKSQCSINWLFSLNTFRLVTWCQRETWRYLNKHVTTTIICWKTNLQIFRWPFKELGGFGVSQNQAQILALPVPGPSTWEVPYHLPVKDTCIIRDPPT